jgi:hypothetical protein
MADSEKQAHVETIENDVRAGAKRPYERPSLTHLGSVNRLTLSVSGTHKTDGTKPTAKQGQS